MQHESSSPALTPTTSAQQAPPPQMPSLLDPADPAQVQAQQDFIRSMLRAQEPQQGQEHQGQDDPMMKLLQSIIGGANEGDPNNPAGFPVSPEDISKATGLPPFVTNMLLGQQKAPLAPAQEQRAMIWRIVQAVLSISIGIHLIRTITVVTTMFGANPPAPPTILNPFSVFVFGELFTHGIKSLAPGGTTPPKGFSAWWQVLKDVARDGSVVIFMLGATIWWKGSL